MIARPLNLSIPIDISQLHDYFKDVFNNNVMIPSICYEPNIDYNENPDLSFLNADFDLDEVMTTLQNLTFKKSSGPDLITNEMLFNAKDYLAPIFLNVFQFIF